MTDEQRASWVYRAAMMLIGLANIGGALWAHFDLAYGDWPAGTEQQRLQYLFWLGVFAYALMGMQLYGLISRNLGRIKLRMELAKLGKLDLE